MQTPMQLAEDQVKIEIRLPLRLLTRPVQQTQPQQQAVLPTHKLDTVQ
jgi:hypothetical protein